LADTLSQAVIDLHCHILPGLDDGPEDLDEALALARATVDRGIDEVVATPHVSSRYPNRAAGIGSAVARLRAELDREQIPLKVHAGAEIALDQLAELSNIELARLTLGGGPFLLLESPLESSAGDAAPSIRQARQRGFRVVLAHPERSPQFLKDPATAAALAAEGVLLSITAGALAGRFGRPAQSLSEQLVHEGHAHNLCSDMHDLAGRPPGILQPLRDAGALGAELIQHVGWFAEDVPRTILEGGRFPPGPVLGSVPTRSAWGTGLMGRFKRSAVRR
jgi:protein-tyrosine phosphatase